MIPYPLSLNTAMKKKAFLLLEILIALSLASILLFFLFSFFTQSVKMESKIQKTSTQIFQKQKFHNLIQDYHISIANAPELPSFYTKKFGKEKCDSLVFLLDHGIDPNPEFCGIILTKIFLDHESNLSICFWPLLEDKKISTTWRMQTLLKNVQNVKFSFIGDSLGQSDKKEFSWEPSWPKNGQNLPLFMKMEIEQNGKTFSHVFLLPNHFPIPTYNKTL